VSAQRAVHAAGSRHRFLAAVERRFAFNSRANIVAATLFVSLLGGCVSLWLGQDANWDLRNYHLYNGYAALHGRLALDLAPAQMQSYFSPLLDIAQYLLLTGAPGALSGFLMGVLHGLLFLPAAGIAWCVLDGRKERAWLAPLLALSGLCMGAVLSEFGNTMADNTTALFVLCSVWWVLRMQAGAALPRPGHGWLLAGALIGFAVALKLTNAIYAVGLAAAVLAGPGHWISRFRALLLVTLAAMVVAVLSVGWWYWQVWQQFGNPLFPQFNALFQSPLAAQGSIGDTRWLPEGFAEHLAWPLLFTFDPKRISEVSLTSGIWAMLAVAMFLLLARRLLGRREGGGGMFAPVLRSLVVFFVVSYLLWQTLFSIHRYLVALELIAPLLLWCACVALRPSPRGMRMGGWAIGVCVLISLAGWGNWGHERWASNAFEVQQPRIDSPGESVVLLVGGDPQAWRVAFLPRSVRYAAVASNFPESEGYRAHLRQMLLDRPQQFAIFPGSSDKLAARFESLNAKVAMAGLDRESDCAKLRWLTRRLKGLRSDVQVTDGRCVLIPRNGALQSVMEAEAEQRALAQSRLAAYGLMLVPGSCITLTSRIGQGQFPYQWCRLTPAR
jgi:hypothetical protein